MDSSSSDRTEIKLSKWQTEVLADKTRYKVINCGRRSGKSTVASIKMLHFASENSKSIVWYIAPTYRQAKDIMWNMLRELIPQQAVKSKNSQELIIELINGSFIYLKGAEDPDRLRGVRIDMAVFDECAFFNRWDEAWKVIRPTLADSRADVWFISTPNGFNHFKEMSEKQDKDWTYYHFTSYDNPYLEKAEIDQAREEMDEDSFAQEWLGEFRKMSGLIYKGFRRDIHMVDIPNIEGWRRTRAIDFGYGHKMCVIWFAINTTGTEIYAYDGIYESGLTIPDVAEAIKIKDSGQTIYNAVADSAQPGYIEQLTREGIAFNPVEKGPDSVNKGITQVAGLLQVRADTGKPTLMFNKNLDWIAHEFETYRWMENKAQGYVKETPLKRDDDAMDTIRYFATTYRKQTETPVRHVDRKKWSIGRNAKPTAR